MTRMSSRHPLLGVLVVLLAATCFGTLGPISRLSYEAGMEPLGFVAWRAMLGAVALVALVGIRVARGSALIRLGDLTRTDRRALLVAALTLTCVNLAIFIAFDRITVALALLGFYLFPALVAVASAILGWERLDRTRGLALLLALAGVALVVLGQLDPDGGLRFDLLGFLAAVTAAALQAVYILVGRRGYRRVPTEQAVSFFLVASSLAYLLVAATTGSLGQITRPFAEPGVWPLLLFAGLAGAGLPTLLFLTGVRWIGATRTAILAMIEPVVGVGLAALILGEALQPIQLAGGALVLLAGVILQRVPEGFPHEPPDATPEPARPVPAPG